MKIGQIKVGSNSDNDKNAVIEWREITDINNPNETTETRAVFRYELNEQKLVLSQQIDSIEKNALEIDNSSTVKINNILEINGSINGKISTSKSGPIICPADSNNPKPRFKGIADEISANSNIYTEITSLENRIDNLEIPQVDLSPLNQQISQNQQNISRNNTDIANLETKIDNLNGSTTDLSEVNANISENLIKIDSNSSSITELSNKIDNLDGSTTDLSEVNNIIKQNTAKISEQSLEISRLYLIIEGLKEIINNKL